MTNKNAKFETVKAFFALFASARERISIKMHSIESRFAIGPSNNYTVLRRGVYVYTFQPGKFYRLGQ